MSLENVYTYYNYANAIEKTLQETLNISETRIINPVVISNLQLITVSLDEGISYDFLIIKEILSQINCFYALWANSGIPQDSGNFYLYIIFIILNILLNILAYNYNELASQYDIDFTSNEVNFILTGKKLFNLNRTSLNAIIDSHSKLLMNNEVDNAKTLEAVFQFGRLSEKFNDNDILAIINNL